MQGWNANEGWRNLLSAQRYQGQMMNKGISDLMQGVGQYRQNRLYDQAGQIALNGTEEEKEAFRAENMRNPNVIRAFDADVTRSNQIKRQRSLEEILKSGDMAAINEARRQHIFTPEAEAFGKAADALEGRNDIARREAFRPRVLAVLGTESQEDDLALAQEFANNPWMLEEYNKLRDLQPENAIYSRVENDAHNKTLAGIRNTNSASYLNNANAYNQQMENVLSENKNWPGQSLSGPQMAKINQQKYDFFVNGPTQEKYQNIRQWLLPMEQNYWDKIVGGAEQYPRNLTLKEKTDLAKTNAETELKLEEVKAKALENENNQPLEKRIGGERMDFLNNMLLTARDTNDPSLVDDLYISANNDAEREYIQSARKAIPSLTAQTPTQELALKTKELEFRKLQRAFSQSLPAGDRIMPEDKQRLDQEIQNAFTSKDPAIAIDEVRVKNLSNPDFGNYISEATKGISSFKLSPNESASVRKLNLAKAAKEQALADTSNYELSQMMANGTLTQEQKDDLLNLLSNGDYETALSKYALNKKAQDIITTNINTKKAINDSSFSRVPDEVQNLATELALNGDRDALRKLKISATRGRPSLEQKAIRSYIDNMMVDASGFPDLLTEARYNDLVADTENKTEKRQLDKDARQDAALIVLENAAEADLLMDQILQNPAYNNATGLQIFEWVTAFGTKDGPVRGTPEYDLVQSIERLKTMQFLPAITMFKKAGGAGPLSDIEGQVLMKLFSNLDIYQSPEKLRKEIETGRRWIYSAAQKATSKIGTWTKKYPKGYRSVIEAKLKSIERTNPNFRSKGNLGNYSAESLRTNRKEDPLYPSAPMIDPRTGSAIDPTQNQNTIQTLQDEKASIEIEIQALGGSQP